MREYVKSANSPEALRIFLEQFKERKWESASVTASSLTLSDEDGNVTFDQVGCGYSGSGPRRAAEILHHAGFNNPLHARLIEGEAASPGGLDELKVLLEILQSGIFVKKNDHVEVTEYPAAADPRIR